MIELSERERQLFELARQPLQSIRKDLDITHLRVIEQQEEIDALRANLEEMNSNIKAVLEAYVAIKVVQVIGKHV